MEARLPFFLCFFGILFQINQCHFLVLWFKQCNLEIIILAELQFLAELGFGWEGGIMHQSSNAFFDRYERAVLVVFYYYAFNNISFFQFAFKLFPRIFL